MNYQTIRVRYQEQICFIQFHRPEANNTINNLLIDECSHALSLCEDSITIVVLEGLPEVFCFGADFQEFHASEYKNNSEQLYDLWLKLAEGPYITISHVRGKANAGGIGFVTASDIVLAEHTAQFSLSELLFGFYPACVLPFLIRRIGYQKAHYMTLTTQAVSAQTAQEWGLADANEANSEALLHRHLLRLKCLSKKAVVAYKRYMNELNPSLLEYKSTAIENNRTMFQEPENIERIYQFTENGRLPWENK